MTCIMHLDLYSGLRVQYPIQKLNRTISGCSKKQILEIFGTQWVCVEVFCILFSMLKRNYPFFSVAYSCIFYSTYKIISDSKNESFIDFLENSIPILSMVFGSLFGVIMFWTHFWQFIGCIEALDLIDMKLTRLKIYMKYRHWSILISSVILLITIPIYALPFESAPRKTIAYYFICYAFPIEIRGVYIGVLNITHGFIIERMLTLNQYLENNTEELYFLSNNYTEDERESKLKASVTILQQVHYYKNFILLNKIYIGRMRENYFENNYEQQRNAGPGSPFPARCVSSFESVKVEKIPIGERNEVRMRCLKLKVCRVYFLILSEQDTKFSTYLPTEYSVSPPMFKIALQISIQPAKVRDFSATGTRSQANMVRLDVIMSDKS